MKKEKLKIILEVEEIPENAKFSDFRVEVMEDGWFTRISKNWKRIRYIPAKVIKMDIKKL